MYTLEYRGFLIRCENAVDVIAIVNAVSDHVGAPGPKPAPAPAPAPRHTRTPEREPSSHREPPKLGEGVVGIGGRRIGRAPTWSDEELVELHARLKQGERIEELAAERGKLPRILYQAFKRKGLPVKFARPNPDHAPEPQPAVPIRRLAAGASGIEDEKGVRARA